jgi:hypothetical protein
LYAFFTFTMRAKCPVPRFHLVEEPWLKRTTFTTCN